jgi:hypothetical protein
MRRKRRLLNDTEEMEGEKRSQIKFEEDSSLEISPSMVSSVFEEEEKKDQEEESKIEGERRRASSGSFQRTLMSAARDHHQRKRLKRLEEAVQSNR